MSLCTIEAQWLAPVIECLARGAADLVCHDDYSIIVGDDMVECESVLAFRLKGSYQPGKDSKGLSHYVSTAISLAKRLERWREPRL